MHESEIELDKKIEAALTTYADPAESLNSSALAARVLAAARDKQKGIQWWRWGLAATVPALAVLLIVLYFPAKPKMESVRLTASAPPPHQIMVTPPAKQMVSHTVIKSRYVPPSHLQPKLDVFPTPRPLSEQEKLMVAFVQDAPQEAQKQAAQDSEPIQPITIADLTIPPLDPPAKDGAKTGDRK
jgi:hypothetical protein